MEVMLLILILLAKRVVINREDTLHDRGTDKLRQFKPETEIETGANLYKSPLYRSFRGKQQTKDIQTQVALDAEPGLSRPRNP